MTQLKSPYITIPSASILLCILLSGCGVIPQSEFQDANTLGTGLSTLSLTPSPLLECRYQVGIAERSDVSVSGYVNVFPSISQVVQSWR